MVQVGTFSRRQSAEDLRTDLARRFPDVHVSAFETGWNQYFRVRVGPYEARDEAEAQASRVGRLGYTPIIVRAPRP
jgi:cell division protein FtsN